MQPFVHSPEAGVFALLMNQTAFAQAFVKQGDVTWPDDLDLAPLDAGTLKVTLATLRRRKKRPKSLRLAPLLRFQPASARVCRIAQGQPILCMYAVPMLMNVLT
jgi:hypothetical protein